MKTSMARFSLFFATAFSTQLLFAAAPPHLELDLTSAEYRALLAKRHSEADAGNLQPALDVGKRLLSWIEALNAQRADDKKLELSTPATQRGIPVTSPKIYNRTIVRKEFDEAMSKLPEDVAKILKGKSEFPTTLSIDDDTFLELVRVVDRAYQSASRWLLLEPYLDYLADRSAQDVRGYYFLSREDKLEDKLSTWKDLDDAERTRLTPWLVGLCHNSYVSYSQCGAELKLSAEGGSTLGFFKKYLPEAKAVWDAFFRLDQYRSDVAWTGKEPNVMYVPFLDPKNAPVKNWLQENIEDEWRHDAWQLKLDFKKSGSDIAHVEFEDGATPHVNGLAGNVITMDANRSINEYSSKWTIRHEYGHVLGFPDCYVEFYDEDAEVMINYQLDTTNLMCSRTGHLLDTHVEELKRVYFTK